MICHLAFHSTVVNLEWRCIGHFGAIIPALKQNRRFLLLLHCNAMDCGDTQKGHRSFGRWKNSTQLNEIEIKTKIDALKAIAPLDEEQQILFD